ncbi:EAL domain-containing protein [Rhodoferax aquaticus]|nr:EAL domain-containing protein [Rhodoferax aquaticus]
MVGPSDDTDRPVSLAAHDWRVANPATCTDNPWMLAMESSGLGAWDWNIATGEQTHSKRWLDMLGYSVGDIANNNQAFMELVHPDDVHTVKSAFTAYLRGDQAQYAMDVRLRCKNGQWKWIATVGTIVQRDEKGRPVHMIGTHIDISERKRVEDNLRELNAQLLDNTSLLQTTLTSISQGIVLTDGQQRVRKFNPRMCELLDLPLSFMATLPTLQEVTHFQMVRGDFGPQGELIDSHARTHVMDVAAGGPSSLLENYLRVTPSGRTLEVRSQALPDGGLVRTFADVTNYVQAEAARKRLDVLLDATQSIARVGGIDHDVLEHTIEWTAGVYRILETAPTEFTPTPESVRRFFTPEGRAAVKQYLASANPGSDRFELELDVITYTGKRICLHVMGTLRYENGRLSKRTAVIQDISERKRTEAAMYESEERLKLALDSTGDGVWDWHIQEKVEFYSKRLLQMFGLAEADLDSNPDILDARTHPDDVQQMAIDRQNHFDGHTPTYMNEHRIRCSDGSWKWVLSRGMVIARDDAGQPERMIGTFTDITPRKESEALIRKQAFFDPLTGLPNRRMLRDRLDQKIKKSRREDQQLAILFIDLDHFKEVNDTLGHASGDLLLVEAAQRIQSCVRETDTVSRMGGDEFTLIVGNLDDADSLERILHKLLSSLSEVFQLGAHQVFVSASIGITMYPSDATEVEDLFKNADQALYVAKGAGRNRFSFFTPALQEAAQTRVRLTHDLRSGLAEQQFKVVYQPIVNLQTGAVHKAEALIRWHHPKLGLVSPASFIPIAESSGLIVDIGEWVFQQAASQVLQWRQRLHPDFQISVNKSPVQFHHDDSHKATWADHLNALGLPGSSIVVEITEGLLLDTGTRVGDHLLELGDAGIQVSLDDFGTGYSSLSYLQKFDIDFIKIDQSFVKHLIPASTDLALCKAIIVMAHALGMKVIAEGVETALQRDLLIEAGCDYGQGYLFARPMAAEDLELYIQSR